jgi:hypothetical protein
MPDQYGFNHLGDNVRCIDCQEGGLIGRWPEHKRARHASTHGNRPKQGGGADVRRQRILLAAPPTDSNEEKEAITMANTATGKGEPAKQMAGRPKPSPQTRGTICPQGVTARSTKPGPCRARSGSVQPIAGVHTQL